MESAATPDIDGHDVEEVTLVAHGIATAVAPESGLTDLQADLLEAIADALTGVSVDYRTLDPLGADELGVVLAGHDLEYRRRIVHHMVLGELVLQPIPVEVARRVATYSEALGVTDDFVRVARRYAQGAYGLAWIDLQRSGSVRHARETTDDESRDLVETSALLQPAHVDAKLEEKWTAFADFPADSLGRRVREMYDARAFKVPGAPGGAPAYLARHDFVHVLADYGTDLKGELEVFGFIGRADPDPKGFAWLATLIGLFETGYITSAGFFSGDVREHNVRAPGMEQRIADAIRRGKAVCESYGVDLFEVDYYDLADRPVAEIREMLSLPPKSSGALDGGSAGVFEPGGMSEAQRRYAEEHRASAAE